jgi:predicted RNase H-like nuclease
MNIETGMKYRTSYSTSIIGVDCATDPKKRGIAVGRTSLDSCWVTKIETGLSDAKIAAFVEDEKRYCTQLLLALDAPLGWPAPMGNALSAHKAGDPFLPTADILFRRETDRFIREKFKKQSLDVGADRIARTAYAALTLLKYLSETSGYPVQLAWDAEFTGIAAIEVYPAATLRSYGLPDSGYKTKSDHKVRQEIIGGLNGVEEFFLDKSIALPLQSADALDAVICCLAGLDFLRGSVHQPADEELARKEGWIWVRK